VKRPTIAEIAARAGVSIGAVSYALNGRPGVSEKTRRLILEISDEIGWRPSVAARSLSGSRAHSVGLLIARPADTLGVEPFFMRFIAGLEGELSRHGVGLLLQFVDDHRAAIEAMRRCWAERRVDGMVLTDLWTEDTRIPVVEELRIPAVLVGGPRADSRLPSVWTDDTAAVTSAVDYLVALGHRRLARVAGLPALEHTQVRIGAFRAAAEAHRRTGVPILTHCEAGTGALEQLRLVVDCGVPADHVVLSHVDKVVDPGYHREILSAGGVVEYDQAFRWGERENGTLRLLRAMVDAGFGDRIVLGMDAARSRYYRAFGGSPGLGFLLREFAPRMDAVGLDAGVRRRLFVDNPAHAFSFTGGRP